MRYTLFYINPKGKKSFLDTWLPTKESINFKTLKEANKYSLIEKLIDGGCLKDSPSTGQHWDYKEDCYEFTKKFRRVYNFTVTPFWLWVKIYVLNFYWFEHKWQKIRIKCGHHYDWQDYEGVDINDI